MTRFRDLREGARARCTLVGRVVAEAINDPELRVTVARTANADRSTTVMMRVSVTCEFHVPDDTPEVSLRKLALLAYRKLAVHSRTHFFDHMGTDPMHAMDPEQRPSK